MTVAGYIIGAICLYYALLLWLHWNGRPRWLQCFDEWCVKQIERWL